MVLNGSKWQTCLVVVLGGLLGWLAAGQNLSAQGVPPRRKGAAGRLAANHGHARLSGGNHHHSR